MLPVRRHGGQGTEGQHPVGSMPVEGERGEASGPGVAATANGLYRQISRHIHFIPFALFFSHEQFSEPFVFP